MRTVPSYDYYWIKVAKVVSLRSKDPRTQVGCVIVNKNNRVISSGYNGMPPGYPEDTQIWKVPTKYKFVIHAESNAIVHAKCDLEGCKLYVSHQPCLECAKQIAASGIKEVVFNEYKGTLDSLNFLRASSIKVRKLAGCDE